MKILGRQILFSLSIRKDRRKAKRLSLHHTLYLDYKCPLDGSVDGSGKGKDISRSGIRFASHSMLPERTLIDLMLHADPRYHHSKTIRIRSCVVWCHKEPGQHHYRVGCVFNQPDEATFQELTSFISWLKERSS